MKFSLLRALRLSSRRKLAIRGRSSRERRVSFEQLESRQMLSVNLGTLNNISVPGGKSVLVPLTGTSSVSGPITYSLISSNPTVQLSIESPTSKSLELGISGTDKDGNAFTGTLVLHLFEDLTPATTSRIETLVGQGYYNGLDFFRVLDGFVAQAGRNGSGDTGVLLDDEFNTQLTFTSPGLLAMANAGPDTGDSEFFITAIDGGGTTTPITLAEMPQFLDFHYTIFGQLVSGFDTFEKMMSTVVTTNTAGTEISMPTHAITITSATIVTDTQNAVLRVTAPATFDGSSATITVVATNSANESVQQGFTASVVTDTATDHPFLGPVTDHATVPGAPVSFTLTSTEVSGGGVSYAIFDPNTLDAPTNVTVAVDDATGNVTLTPNAGVTGQITLWATVKRATDDNTITNFDYQAFTLNVVAPTLSAVDNQTTGAGVPDVFSLHSTDSSGNGIVYSIVDATTQAAPTNVDVAIDQATGQVTLTPHAGFQGTLNLLAGVRDAASPDAWSNYISQAFTLDVSAAPLSPVADQTVASGVDATFTLHASESLGANLVYSVVDASSLAAPTDVDVSIDQATGQVTLSPHSGFSGTVNLLARVRDSSSADEPENYTTQSFALNVITLNPVANHVTGQNEPLSFTLATTPAAGDSIFTIVDQNSFTAPSNVTVLINQSTGVVTLTPATGFSGTINLRAGVRGAESSDDEANYNFQSFSLTVNTGPALTTPVTDQTVPIGGSVSLMLTSSDVTDQDTYYTIVDADTFGTPANVLVTIDRPTGQAFLTPAAGFVGTIHLKAGVRGAEAADVQASYDTQDFTLTVVAPTLNTVADQSTTIGTPVNVTLSATDPLGAGLSYSIVDPTTLAAPDHVTVSINQATGVATLTPDAGFGGAVHLRARVLLTNSADTPTSYVAQDFTLNVNSTVSVAPINDISVPGGKSVLVPLTGVDSVGNPITYTFSSSDPSVQLSLESPASKSLVLNVSGTDKNGVAFTGTLVLHLFEDLSPETTSRIETLVGQGYYDGLDFFRILDGFMAQGGKSGTSDTGVKLTDEFNTSLTFTSPGLLAMANAGRDTADSEFFITAIDGTGATTPIALADMPQYLDFRYTIFGQLVSGFDTFEKIMSTTVTENSAGTEDSQPTNAITITSASIVTDTQNAVLRVTAPASFIGSSADITVTAANTTGQTTQTTFKATAVTDTQTDPPFLGDVFDQSLEENTAETFTLTSSDSSGGGVFYTVVDPTTFSAPANVTISINQSTGQVSLAPKTGFTGTINLLAGVRALSADDTQLNYDMQAFTLTVTADSGTGGVPAAPTSLNVSSSSNTGAFDGNGYISTGTPTLTVTAATGSTVQFKLNGSVVAAGSETTAGSGTYSATLPAGVLAVGANSITAVATNSSGTSADSATMSVVYAPDYNTGVYIVPGAVGTSQTITFDWTEKNASYNNEFGYFIVDSMNGSINGIAPGQAGYAQAALSSSTRQLLFAKGEKAGASINVTLEGGQMLIFYLIQNNTTANFLSRNSTDTVRGNNNSGAPLAFFSLASANPDGMRHTQIIADSVTGNAQYNWEDLLNLGDADFNDAVIDVHPSSAAVQSATLHAPGASGGNVSLSAALKSEKQSTPNGDVGIYFVDSADGAIGGLHPGDPGYAAAALATGNFQVLFTGGASGSSTISVPAGKYLAFFTITSGTVGDFLLSNPTDSSSGPNALFSFDAANPDAVNHFRWYTPGRQSTDPNATELHVMTKVNGKSSDFDSFAIDLAFAL